MANISYGASLLRRREGLREASKASEAACGEEQADYLLGCWWDSSEERLCAVAGSNRRGSVYCMSHASHATARPRMPRHRPRCLQW